MTEPIFCRTFPNGLVLVAEPMNWLESAAFTLLVPAGCVYEPDGRNGLAGFTSEMTIRGAGPRDNRRLSDDLDNLGVDRSESVFDSHLRYSGATLAGNLAETLAIYADILRRPHLPDAQLEGGRQVMLQELRAVEDEPAQKVMIEVQRHHYPSPWGRPPQGDQAALESITRDEIRAYVGRHFRPNGTILGVAGKFDWPEIEAAVERLLGDWPPGDEPAIVETPAPGRRAHLPGELSQTQIGIAYPSVPYRDPRYFQAWGAVGVLGGGTSARLFTEVRERRGLCYSVYATHHALRDRGGVFCYAGTSAERPETLDVMLAELVRLAEGVQAHELDRLKARIKSALIMQQESSVARSSAIARDWYHLGRVRTLDEVGGLIDGLSCQSINAYLTEHPPRDFTVVTLGPRELEVPLEFRKHVLPNGLQIVAECAPQAYSTALGFLVKAGARDESPELAGVSHFLEHMAFKGTPTRTADDVNRQFDQMGADYNAATGEEATVYHAAVLPERQVEAVTLLADILRPSLRPHDFDTEKQVILEEIRMYEDQPPFGAEDKCRAAYFGPHPLGRSVLGTVASVGALSVQAMRDYFHRRYGPGNIVLAAAGKVDFDALVQAVQRSCGPWEPVPSARPMPPVSPQTGFQRITKPAATQQYAVLLSPGPSATDPDRYPAQLLATVLGDDTGSRFFWELIDTGLAENASVGHLEHEGAGVFVTYLSGEPADTMENLQRIREIFRQAAAEGIAPEELAQAKSKISSRIVRASERPRGRLFAVGGNWVQRREYRSVRDDLESVQAITLDQIAAVLAKYPLTHTMTVTIGPDSGSEPHSGSDRH